MALLFDLLKTDHREVKGIMTVLASQDEPDIDMVQELCEKLKLHMKLEEQYFYPALEEYPETAELAQESYLEHQEAKKLIKAIEKGDLDDTELKVKLEMLNLAVTHHVEEEENNIFRKAKQVLSDEEIEEIGNDISAKKEEAQRV
ncbi:MAG TPA: hemerythrin domain-containing protein [Oculatellaceae cyanobacterium]|jgi:hemerythrin-like domain-containing protein